MESWNGKTEQTFQYHEDTFAPENYKHTQGFEHVHVHFILERNIILPVKKRQDQFLLVTKLTPINVRQINNALEADEVTHEQWGFKITY